MPFHIISKEKHPQSYALKMDLRSKEIPLQNNIAEIGDILNMGRGYVVGEDLDATGSITTGLGLCVLMRAIVKDALPKKYPDIQISSYTGEVLSFGSSIRRRKNTYYFVHGWNELYFPGEPRLFFDGTFPQVNPTLNRSVLDLEENRKFYHPKSKNINIAGEEEYFEKLMMLTHTSELMTGIQLPDEKICRLIRLSVETEALFGS